jgi:hypothetical protein
MHKRTLRNASRLLSSVLCLAMCPLLVAQQASEAPRRLEGAVLPPPGPKAIIPKHTKILFILLETISSATGSKGQLVRMAVAKDVSVNGVVLIPKGTPATGVIDFVRKAVPGKKDGDVSIKPISVNLPTSKSIALRRYNEPEGDALGEALLPLLPFCFVATLVAIPFHRKHETGKEYVLEDCFGDWWELSHAIVIAPSGATSFEPTPAARSEAGLNAACPNGPRNTIPTIIP